MIAGTEPSFLHSDLNYAGRIIIGGPNHNESKKKKKDIIYVKQGSLLHDVNEFLTNIVTDWLR